MKKKVTVKGYRWYAWGQMGSGIEDVGIGIKAAKDLGIENFSELLDEDQDGTPYIGEEALEALLQTKDRDKGRYVVDVSCGDGGIVVVEGLDKKDYEDLMHWHEISRVPEEFKGDEDEDYYKYAIEEGSADDVSQTYEIVKEWLQRRGYKVEWELNDCVNW